MLHMNPFEKVGCKQDGQSGKQEAYYGIHELDD